MSCGIEAEAATRALENGADEPFRGSEADEGNERSQRLTPEPEIGPHPAAAGEDSFGVFLLQIPPDELSARPGNKPKKAAGHPRRAAGHQPAFPSVEPDSGIRPRSLPTRPLDILERFSRLLFSESAPRGSRE